MTGWIDRITGLSQPSQFFVWLILVLLFVSGLLVMFILISRLIKNYTSLQNRQRILFFQPLLNALVFMDSEEEIKTAEELKLLQGQLDSSSAKQLLMEQLKNLKRNLTGSPSTNIDFLFQALSLDRYALRKLHQGLHWKTRAEAIQELSIFSVRSAIPAIQKYITAENRTVQEEALMALIRLDLESSLAFLDSYTAQVSPWMRIRIHHHLSKMNARALPLFSQWMDHPVVDVSLFSISMARQFRQLSAVPLLIKIIQGNDKIKIGPSIRALGEIGAHEAVDAVISIVDKYWSDRKISLRIVKCLGELGHQPNHLAAVVKFLSHPEYVVRLQAARALMVLQPNELAKQTQLSIAGIVRHVQEPLLQS